VKNETAASASEGHSGLCGSALNSKSEDGNEPGRLSQLQVAALLNVSRQTIFIWSRVGLPRNPDLTYDPAAVVRWLRTFYRAGAQKKYQARLESLRRKFRRNIAQIERFINGAKVE
jgi:hypothetical protein